MVGTKLFIGNLPDTVNKDELQAMFEKFGKVAEFDILKDYGFVVNVCFQLYLPALFMKRQYLFYSFLIAGKDHVHN